MRSVTTIIVALHVLGTCRGDLQTAVESGRAQYELLRIDSNQPRFGDCWKRALEVLHKGCRELTDDVQARLALSFANCFLIRSGLKSYPCDSLSSVADCLNGIDNNAFTAYSNFFTHTHNMCQFLQAQVWREQTEDTINNLTAHSARVAAKLQESSDIQDTIVKNQMQTLEYQKQIIANGSVLSQALELSKSNVREMLQEFRVSTDEQRMLIFSIFDRVAKLQNIFISEVSWIYTMLFYVVTMVVLYLVTATKRTAEARLGLFLTLTLNFCLERIICSLSLPDSSEYADHVTEVISDRIWLLRKISLLICFSILSYYAATFKDYNLINNKLLHDICRQNQQLFQALEVLKGPQLSLRKDFTDCAVANDDSESDEDDDTNSFDSSLTDRTWMSFRDIESSDDESHDVGETEDLSFLEEDFFTAANNSPSESGNTTPTNKDEDSTLSQDILNPSCHDLLPTDQVTREKCKIKRKGLDWSRASTPVQHRYNLRRRRNFSTFDNPILDSESPNSFGKLVSRLGHITQKNSMMIRQKFRELQLPNPIGEFSSDDENVKSIKN